jgi:photosystem II stability/assembly factor-like uncharacterized protein
MLRTVLKPHFQVGAPSSASSSAAADSVLLRTDDGGASWARQVSLHPEDERAAVERETAGS